MTRLTGVTALTRLALRRDRLRLPVWLLSIGALAAGVTSSVAGLYLTDADRTAQATFAAGNVVTRAFNGPASGASLGSLVLVESFATLSVLVGVLVVQTVVRHTRAEEEAGRSELVGAAVVGRDAQLTAALLVAAGASVASGAAFWLVLALHDLPVWGSLLAGLALSSVGLVVAGVTAVIAQVASTARAATGAATAVLGAAFVARAVGDATGEVVGGGTVLQSGWASWLSPIGWGQQVRPFGDPRVDVLLVPVTVTLLLLVAAVALVARRDVGAGLVPPRPGPPRAGRRLRTGLGLAWRLQRGAVWAWIAGLAVVGISFGAVGSDVDQVVGDNRQLLDVLAAAGGSEALLDAYIAFSVGFLAVAAVAVPTQLLLRARREEQDGRVEPLLATALSRSRWLTGHLVVAAIAGVAATVTVGAAAAAAYGAVTGDAAGAAGFVGAALAHVPATLAVTGVTAAAVALVPRSASPLAWAVVALNVVLGQLGSVLGLPDATIDLAPSAHVPAVPADPLTWTPLLVLLGVALITTAVAVTTLGRRDLATVA